jgi:DNA polymerase-3 subunit beta
MKATIDRNSLLRLLSHTQSIVERRNTIPILLNVRIEAAPGELGIGATDMDLEIVEAVAANVAVSGALTAPAHTLYDIVRKLPEGQPVELEGSSDRLMLRCGRSRFTLPCLPVEDFPVMSAGPLPWQFVLAAKDLRTLIERTRFAISTEETRYYLNGIYFHAVRQNGVDMLRAVATDGHRLASVQVPLPAGAAGLVGVIVPRKCVTEVYKLLEGISDEVAIALSETKIRFRIGAATLTSKLIDGTFPDYERVIPTGNDRLLDVDRRAFAEAVDRVSAIASDRSRAVKLTIRDGTLVLAAHSPDQGSASEELEVHYSGEGVEIGFNSRYLLDITQQIEGDSARLMLADAASPTIISAVGDANALYVLMPMRV